MAMAAAFPTVLFALLITLLVHCKHFRIRRACDFTTITHYSIFIKMQKSLHTMLDHMHVLPDD